MDEMTQQNAALVEQAAAAAESLQEQAAMLAEAVSVFKLGDGDSRQVRKQRRAEPVSQAAAPAAAKAAPVSTRSDVAVATRPASPVVPAGNGDEWEEF
jgi:hypothetical protein